MSGGENEDERNNIADHLSADEVRMKMQMSSGFLKFQKWLVIYNLLVDPRPLAEIAMHTGLSESSVYRIISEYNNGGPDSIEPIGQDGSARLVRTSRNIFNVIERPRFLIRPRGAPCPGFGSS